MGPSLSRSAREGLIHGIAASGHEAVGKVVGDRGGVALGGGAPAAAAAGFENEPIAGADEDAGLLGLDGARFGVAGIERVAVRHPVLAAKDAAGAVPHPLPGRIAD